MYPFFDANSNLENKCAVSVRSGCNYIRRRYIRYSEAEPYE